MGLDWGTIIVAIIGSSVVAALVEYYGERRKQDVEFKNEFRKELISKRLTALEEVTWLLERLRIAKHVNPNIIKDLYGHLDLNEDEIRKGFSIHDTSAQKTVEIEILIDRITAILQKELWINYNTYLLIKMLKDIFMDCLVTNDRELFGLRNYRLIEEYRLRLQIEVSKSQKSIENLDGFIDEKISRAEKRLNDFLEHE